MIPQETVDRILDSTRIAEVIGDFVSLKRQGSAFVACCPFHNEKTPSFHVNPSKGIFKCFGCGESGSAVGFLMKHEGMTYPESMRYLARKYGIEIREREETAEDFEAKSRRQSLLLVLEFASAFYSSCLEQDEGRTVGLAYFRSRGLEDETVRKYGLGWAPKSRHAFYDAAKAKGYKDEYILAAGLCRKYDDGRIVDKFHDRVMFPIHSHNGQVIGFGGRTLLSDKTVPKYVNSDSSEVYDKSMTLYGIKFAKSSISRENKCYLVEGYLDVLSMHQIGITNVVASSGTSLTVGQARLIRKFTDNVTIMYDGDPAGIKAAVRGIGLLLKEGIRVRVLILPDGDDPDSFSRKHTLGELREFISLNEKDFIEFKAELLSGEAGNDPVRRSDMINDMADTIALIPDAVTRSVYSQTISMHFDVDQTIIMSRIRRMREKMMEDSRKDLERERMRSGTDAPAAGRGGDIPEAGAVSGRGNAPAADYPLLLAGEEELLKFILENGLTEMEFETDSVYFNPEEKPTVAAFISVNLEDEGLTFLNKAYARAYDLYFDYYDNHPEMDQEAMVRAMADGQDREVADLVTDLVMKKYDLTVERLAASMTAVSTQLVKFVPRAIMAYQLARNRMRGQELNGRLRTADEEETVTLFGEIQALNEKRKILETALGRVR